MGTDSVKLFNKKLSDKMLALNKRQLIKFVEENLDELKDKEKRGIFVHSLVLFLLYEQGDSIAQTAESLLKNKNSLSQLKEELIYDLAFGEEKIYLDYWGCYAEIFKRRPRGSLSSIDYFGDQEEQYLFLKPVHVDRMILSLKQHLDDLRVMNQTRIERLEYFRDYCAKNPDYWVAYIFDF